MASAAVFSIPELLEGILVNLDFDNVLRASEVSSAWRSTIRGSPSLQRTLFLRPIPPTSFLGRRRKPRYTWDWRPFISTPDNRHARDQPVTRPNPLLMVHPGSAVRSQQRSPSLDFRAVLALSDAESPWLDMFATQPPVKSITLEIDVERQVLEVAVGRRSWRLCGRCTAHLNVDIDGGVRLSDLVRAWRGVGRRIRPSWQKHFEKTFYISDLIGPGKVVADPPVFRLGSRRAAFWLPDAALDSMYDVQRADVWTEEAGAEWPVVLVDGTEQGPGRSCAFRWPLEVTYSGLPREVSFRS